MSEMHFMYDDERYWKDKIDGDKENLDDSPCEFCDGTNQEHYIECDEWRCPDCATKDNYAHETDCAVDCYDSAQENNLNEDKAWLEAR